MYLKYDYQNMRDNSRRLKALVAEFAATYAQIANEIEWQGPARDKFDDAVQRSLANVVAMMNDISEIPEKSANLMEEKDAEEAARVRKIFSQF